MADQKCRSVFENIPCIMCNTPSPRLIIYVYTEGRREEEEEEEEEWKELRMPLST